MTVATTSPVSWPLCLPRFGTPRRPERKTLGPQVGLVAEAMGKPLMPWQQHVADVALEIDPTTGRFAYREIVLTVPRRSGKSLLLLAVLVQRMVAMGRPQVAAFTMQNALQARLRMRREWDAEILARSSLASAYRFTGQPGAEALLFNNGSRIEVTASTKSSGHGLTLDLAVVDEAFDQPDDRLEQAFRPAIRTQPDAQLWWVSTAGGPEDVWFKAKVEQARAEVEVGRGMAVFDWSAPEDADPGDPAVWWETMPALGYVRPDGSGLTEQDIREEYQSALRGDTLDGFRRAYLNQWVSRTSTAAFDLDAWQTLTDPADRSGSLSFGVAVAPDQSWSAIGAAWRRPDGLIQVSSVAYQPGTSWLAAKLEEVRRSHPGRGFGDRGAMALSLPNVEKVDTAQSHNGFASAVEGRGIRHRGSAEPELLMSVRGARWKPMGETRVLDRKGSTEISPLDAVARAAYGLQSAATFEPFMIVT